MTRTTEIPLIDGTFSTSEAKEILMNLYTSKIQFHEMKDFSSRERFGIPDAHSARRIPELVEAKVVLAGILNETRSQPVQIRLTSYVNIEVVNEVPQEDSAAAKSM